MSIITQYIMAHKSCLSKHSLLLVNQKRLQVDFDGDTRLLLYRNVLYFFNILVLAIAGRDFRLLLLIIKSELILLIIVSDDIS